MTEATRCCVGRCANRTLDPSGRCHKHRGPTEAPAASRRALVALRDQLRVMGAQPSAVPVEALADEEVARELALERLRADRLAQLLREAS